MGQAGLSKAGRRADHAEGVFIPRSEAEKALFCVNSDFVRTAEHWSEKRSSVVECVYAPIIGSDPSAYDPEMAVSG